MSLTCVKRNMTICSLQHSIHILNCFKVSQGLMIFLPVKQPGHLQLSLPQPLSKALKFFSLRWLNFRCSHHPWFSPAYATFMQKHVLQRARLAASGACGDGSNKCQPGGGPWELHSGGARKGGTHKCVTSPTVLRGGKLLWQHQYWHLQAYRSRALGMSVAPWSPYPVLPRLSSNSVPVQYSQGLLQM